MDPQAQEAINTAKVLWIGLGFLFASNVGTLFKIWWDAREKKADRDATGIAALTKAVEQQTKAMNDLDTDMRRLFTAVKILAGKKWIGISKIIQEEVPRS